MNCVPLYLCATVVPKSQQEFETFLRIRLIRINPVNPRSKRKIKRFQNDVPALGTPLSLGEGPGVRSICFKILLIPIICEICIPERKNKRFTSNDHRPTSNAQSPPSNDNHHCCYLSTIICQLPSPSQNGGKMGKHGI